jgi:K+/H+ antiporter YhaU regulatory subunit KhtT
MSGFSSRGDVYVDTDDQDEVIDAIKWRDAEIKRLNKILDGYRVYSDYFPDWVVKIIESGEAADDNELP